ncbi:hypothetical protein OIU77_011566, partial [Salix suchowensis]
MPIHYLLWTVNTRIVKD